MTNLESLRAQSQRELSDTGVDCPATSALIEELSKPTRVVIFDGGGTGGPLLYAHADRPCKVMAFYQLDDDYDEVENYNPEEVFIFDSPQTCEDMEVEILVIGPDDDKRDKELDIIRLAFDEPQHPEASACQSHECPDGVPCEECPYYEEDV